MKVSLHPGARKDVEDAAAFYEREGSAALAARFVASLEQLIALLIRHPSIGSPQPGNRRSFSMSTFPYTVVYRLHPEEIEVLVVKHDRKHPGFGRSRS